MFVRETTTISVPHIEVLRVTFVQINGGQKKSKPVTVAGG